MMELLYVISDLYAGGWRVTLYSVKRKVSKMDPSTLLCVISDQSRIFVLYFFLHFLLEGVSTEKCGGCDDNLMLIGH